jgi:hypothetical protein
MGSLTDLARHWTRQTEKGKGLRIEAGDLDVLNAIGVGQLILTKAAEAQREACNLRILSSTPAANTGSPMIESETESFDPVSPDRLVRPRRGTSPQPLDGH